MLFRQSDVIQMKEMKFVLVISKSHLVNLSIIFVENIILNIFGPEFVYDQSFFASKKIVYCLLVQHHQSGDTAMQCNGIANMSMVLAPRH